MLLQTLIMAFGILILIFLGVSGIVWFRLYRKVIKILQYSKQLTLALTNLQTALVLMDELCLIKDSATDNPADAALESEIRKDIITHYSTAIRCVRIALTYEPNSCVNVKIFTELKSCDEDK